MAGQYRTYVLPWLILAACLTITYLSWNTAQHNATQVLQTRFDHQVHRIVDDINKRMKTYEQVMRGVDGLFAHADVVRRDEFKGYVAKLQLKESYPGIQSIHFVQLVSQADKERHIAAALRDGLPAYLIWPLGERKIYAPIIYIEPHDDSTLQSFGYDMFSDLEYPQIGDSSVGLRRAAMEQARDSGKPSISGRIRLPFETDLDKHDGFVMFLPVYRHGAVLDTIAKRRANIIGWISSVFRTGDLMGGILGEGASEFDIGIYDGEEVSDKGVMYDSTPFVQHQHPRFRSFQHISIAGHPWTISVHSLPQFEAQIDRDKPRLIAVIGVAASFLFTLFIWLLVTGRARALQVSLLLNQELHERQQAEQALRASEELFRSVFDHSKVGITLLGMDYKYVKVNRAFCEMTGYPEIELLKHDFQEITHRDDIETNLEWTNKLHAGEIDSFNIEKQYIRKDGSILHGELTVSAVWDADDKLVFIIVIVQDVTERIQFQKKLLMLSRAVENSPATVVITDRIGTIEYVNKKFTSITGYSFEEAVGQSSKMLNAGKQNKEFYKELWATILSGNEWQGEMYNKKKNGEVFIEQVFISPVMDEHGAIDSFVAVKEDITDKKKTEETIWKQANFDTLTGLPNRRMFRERLEQEIKKSNRNGLPIALMFIDLDHFKEINDTLGHDIGDILLIEASRRIGDCVRATDIVARMGGDEFTVLLVDIDDVSSVERIAQNIIHKLAASFQLKDEIAYVSASIGITLYPNDASDIEGLFKHADQAMYVAKEQGRNRHSYFTHALQEAAQTRLRLVNDLRGALAAEQFVVYFQPIVELATGGIHKAEALIRWVHPERGLVSPANFIGLAEETGLILGIGDWVFQESTRWAKRWRDSHCPDFQVSVNKSPIQFYKDGEEHTAWLSHMREIDLPGEALVVEITEGLLLDSNTSINGALLTLRDAGIQVSIDDFGTGYSSLSYLKKFDIDYLKIDQSFVRHLAVGHNDMVLCEAIIVMAHKLGIKVIAEGVETKEQRDILVAAGCDYAQGYLYSRPVPADEFEELLKQG
ncbi:MAG: EAL domain-containing protein [Gallionella sp.]|nr:EAL domain-containing protein [Gallionella sp.]